jgi:hypothetical protein
LNDSGKTLSLAAGAPPASGGGDCGTRYAFDILVTLTGEVTAVGDFGHKVPRALGGGS